MQRRARARAPDKLSKKIIEECNAVGICPIRFGSGLWAIGNHSLELLLEGFCLHTGGLRARASGK